MKRFFIILTLFNYLVVLAASASSNPAPSLEDLRLQAQQLKSQLQQIQQKERAISLENYRKNKKLVNNLNVADGEGFWSKFNRTVDLPLGIGLIILALLIITWLFLPSRVDKLKAKMANPYSLPQVEEDEYDYLNSHEAIPAKFDLARAYIDMGEVSNARQILEDIVCQGTLEQQAEASALLEKM